MLTCLLSILLTAAPPQFEVQTLDGRAVVGPIKDVTAEQIAVETAEGPVSLELTKLLGIEPKEKPAAPAAEAGMVVELIDGSTLPAREYLVASGKAKITLADGQTIEAPRGGIASVRFQAQSEAVAAEWVRMLERKSDGDLLVVRKGDSIDYHKGALRDVTDQIVQFDLDGEVLPVKRPKVHGLIYWQPPGDPLPEALCRLTDASGAQWSVRSLALPGELQWTTPAGLTVVRPLAAVAQIDFSRGKIVFLSDVKPESVTIVPDFGSEKDLPSLAKFYAPRQDKNLESGPLQLGGKRYGKGLALHSRSQLVYRLPEGFRRFQAVAGIDDSVRPLGNVHLIIRGDDKVLLDTTVAGTDPPKPIEADLQGVRRLTIVADFGERLGEGGHLDLCDARILK